jgi:(heptosyl)LPS beta-1,4-glucosyltransferase
VKLTVTVITRNEAANIEGALESVKWADEILVVDSHSADDTVALAGRYAARIVIHDWEGYSAQRNYAAEIASHEWILAIDADERVPPELAAEIQRILRDGSDMGGYRMPRVSYYLGRWIRGTDWYPDYQLRLYDRRVGRFNGKRVHESVELKQGRPGTLEHDLQHYPYRDISDHVTSIDHYTTLAAEEWFAEGRRTNPVEAAVHPPAAFLRNYFVRRGFRDGTAGFLISILNSYYVFLKILKLWELQRGFRTPGPGEAPGASSARRRPKFARTPNVEGRAASAAAAASDPLSTVSSAARSAPPSAPVSPPPALRHPQ